MAEVKSEYWDALVAKAEAELALWQKHAADAEEELENSEAGWQQYVDSLRALLATNTK